MRSTPASSLSIERGIARVRLVGLAFLSALLALLPATTAPSTLPAAFALSFGWAYALAFLLLRMNSARARALACVADGAFIVAWVAVTGGYASPFFPVVYLAIMASVLLVGSRGALVVTLAHGVAHAATAAWLGQLAENAVGLAARVAFMGFTAAFGIVFAREIEARAEEGASLRERVAAAEDAEARFRGLLETAPDAIVIENASGALVFANARAEAVFGVQRGGLVGAPLASLLESHSPGDATGTRADGSRFPAKVSAQPHDTPGGRVVTSIVRDVTETKRAEEALRESEASFRALASAAFEGIAIHDNGIVLEANEAMAAIYGYSTRELIGMGAESLVAPESRLVVAERLALRSNDPYEVVGLRKDGSRIELEVVGRDTPYRGRTVRVTAIRDVTERKRTEAERDANRERLRELDRLREINEMKTQLINTAAHELGTPLTPIKLHLHLLRNARSSPLPEAEARSLAVIERNVDRLIRLVQDFLDVARLEANRLALDRKPMDVNRVVVEAVESFAESARLAGVALESRLTPDLALEADARRISQVIFNLLSNALKFTKSGGAVVVETRRTEDAAIVRVTDDGAGLSADQIGKLFQPFSQVHDTMQKTRSGTGLGLYISRGIAEQHGGNLTCTSPGPGKGATFTLVLPLHAREPAAPRAQVELRESASGRAPFAERQRNADASSVAGRARDLV